MSDVPLPPELRELIAERFKPLREPARIQILNTLRKREMRVSEVMVEEAELRSILLAANGRAGAVAACGGAP